MLTKIVFDKIYIYIYIYKFWSEKLHVSYLNKLRKSLGLSLGFAMTLVMDTMVLRLILGLSHGCGLGLRSLDLLVLLNHNYNLVTLVYKWAVKNLKKISFIIGFRDTCSWVFEENVVSDNFRALTFWWIGPEVPRFACLRFWQKAFRQICRKVLVTSNSHIFWLVYLFSAIQIAMFSFLSPL